MLSLDSVVVVSPDQVSSDMAGEQVMLQLVSGEYYGLNETGAFVWQAIQQPKTVRAVRDALLDAYAVDAAEGERDLMALLEALVAAQLVVVKTE